MRKLLFPLAVALVLISCAPKVKKEKLCPPEQAILSKYSQRVVPEEFRIYGTLKYGPLKFPFMLSKFDGFYTLKVAKVRKVELSSDRFCLDKKCYLLPDQPENLIFGKVLTGEERSLCKDGTLYFRSEGEIYIKEVAFEGERPKELTLYNPRKDKDIKVIFGKENPKGFFEELSFVGEGTEVKLEIEEVEL